MSLRILVVDDEKDVRDIMVIELRDAGYHVEAQESAVAALHALKTNSWDAVLTDLCMPKMDGIQFLKEIRSHDPDISVILLTAHGGVKDAVEAMREGATDFLVRPFDFDQLRIRLERLEESRNLRKEIARLRKAAGSTEIVAESPGMKQLLDRVRKAAASTAAVLILGESGTGKECIAHRLFQHSTEARKVFVARNCAAIPENLFESEMFGHNKGAFTGADKERKGAFLEADGGTLFLDEIGDLSYSLQTKLLRAIQEGVIHPVGSDKDIPVNVRIVCATNKDLRECCKTREFREDLYYRLATIVLTVPPLRERREDISALAFHFVGLFSGGTRALAPATVERLLSHDWPGNVRELRSVIEQGIVFSAGNEIQPDELVLPESFSTQSMFQPQSLAESERRHILKIMKNVNGNKTEAAKVLGISRTTLLVKLHAYEESCV